MSTTKKELKFTVTAVIPTVQYGNIQPSIEVEAESYEKAQEYAMPKIEELWAKYSEKPLPKASNGDSVRLKAFVGGEIDWDERNHIYSWEGERYLSGSKYASSKKKPFDVASISQSVATKRGVKAEDVVALWDLKKKVSQDFGTAIHGALELYGKYKDLALTMEKDTHLHSHPILRKAVQEFYTNRQNDKAEYEIVVVDHDAKRAGTIDRLLVTGDKKCRVQDFKTSTKTDIAYWKDQLDFYAGIMEAGGWKVEGKDVFQWDGAWKEHTIK